MEKERKREIDNGMKKGKRGPPVAKLCALLGSNRSRCSKLGRKCASKTQSKAFVRQRDEKNRLYILKSLTKEEHVWRYSKLILNRRTNWINVYELNQHFSMKIAEVQSDFALNIQCLVILN